MSTKQLYQIGKIKKLIDLNGESVNFEINFRVSSKIPFHILVVDQTTLDNSRELEYKLVDKGEITGSVRNDKNVYQNYFLILKSDKDCECLVEINKKELPKNNNISIPELESGQDKKFSEQPEEKFSERSLKKSEETTGKSMSWSKLVFIFLGLILIGGAIYYFIFKKKSYSSVENNKTVSSLQQRENITNDIPAVSPMSSPVISPKTYTNTSILDRLKRIELE